MSVKIFKDLVLFSMDQLNAYIRNRNKDFEANKDLEYRKPIVYKENLAFFEEELLYLSKTREFIKEIDPKQFKTPDDFKTYLLKKISDYYSDNGVPHACYIILNEKLELALNFYNNLNHE